MEEQKQVDIKKMDVAELWKLAYEQQKQLTQLLAQIQQTQANISAIKEEIKTRES